MSVVSGAASWALLWLRVPLAQIVAIGCGVVVLRRTRSNDEPSLLTASAGSGFMLGLVALVVSVVLHTAPDSFWVDE
ncbi:hypothetical protein [Yinghuangia sp. YIM S10712]|uniref:hypothetical protein n=1 Tax=Yinghuangia sp. YIM S10712 TaxID=3436930 RepID=UPI003F53659A